MENDIEKEIESKCQKIGGEIYGEIDRVLSMPSVLSDIICSYLTIEAEVFHFVADTNYLEIVNTISDEIKKPKQVNPRFFIFEKIDDTSWNRKLTFQTSVEKLITVERFINAMSFFVKCNYLKI